MHQGEKVNKMQRQRPWKIRQKCDGKITYPEQRNKEEKVPKGENEQQQDTEEEERDMKEKNTWPD